ncbi:MAG TPA: hypothetical protein VKY65_01425 [Alphaproteobacteria bacterium]|nr:hypothetical protein [Alphaproteobacteria bacterium]
MTTATKQTLHDEHNNQHEFWVHEIGVDYKAIGGVYVFARDDGTKWTIIYIGETDSFHRRLNDEVENHHRIDCIRRNKATHILTLAVSDDQKRLDLETSLRHRYDPVCNRQ